MKLKLFLLFFVLASVVLYCQDKKNIHGEVPPYKVIGNRTLNLSSNFFTSDMKGTASLVLIIDRKCNLINFAIVKISVSDEKKENVFNFWDSNVLETLAENRFAIIKKDYYPLYVQNLYDLIKEVLNNLKIEYSSDTKDLKDVNELSLLIKVEWKSKFAHSDK